MNVPTFTLLFYFRARLAASKLRPRSEGKGPGYASAVSAQAAGAPLRQSPRSRCLMARAGMDKDIFYGKRGTEDRGVALVPLHPTDSELDSSDDDTSDETVHADTSEVPPSQDHSMTSSPDRSTTASPERYKLVDLITFQTNLYGTQEQGKSIATSAEEIRRFLGILARMGVYKFPSPEDYWSLDGRIPPVADVMPLKRFQAMRCCVHFANNLDKGTNSD
ncbi:hypothetical protein MRX96_026212 [Rhipicephalus microplus]